MDEIFIIIGLILLNGVFAMSEIALISARKSSLTADAEGGLRSARYALKLANEPDRFLSTVQIGITLIGILTGIYSGNKVAALFSEWMAGLGLASQYASMLSQAIIVIVVTYLTLIFGELVPKRIGLTVAEKAAKGVAMPMYALSIAAYPFVWFLSKSTAFIFSLTGLKDKESKVTEEEIKSIIREGTEDGEVQPVEQDIMRRVFLVGDLEVDAIMTHRSELTWLDCDMTAGQVKDIIKENMYAVYPVAEGDLDHVKGVVTIKDLFLSLGEPDFNLRNIMREPTYFYENTDVYKVLEDMKADHISTGLVCDEYGSCIGIITPIEGFTTGHTIIVIACTLLCIKGLDDFILQPTLYSERVKAHPLEVFLVILIAGYMAGILGMLLAIPSYTVLRVLAKEFFSEFSLVQKLTQKI